MKHRFVTACVLLVCAAPPAHAQAVDGDAAATSALARSFTIEGPAPPVLPATMARDTDGRVTARAVRVAAPLRIDGQLDEALYSSYQPADVRWPPKNEPTSTYGLPDARRCWPRVRSARKNRMS